MILTFVSTVDIQWTSQMRIGQRGRSRRGAATVCAGNGMECLAAHAGYTHAHNRVIGEKLLVKLPSAKPVLRNHRVDYAIIGSIADRGTSTCNAPNDSGNNTPWSKKNITPSLTTAKF